MTVIDATTRDRRTEKIGVWFLAIRANTGVDRFTESLVEALCRSGVRAEITWLPHRVEYLPWSVSVPAAPAWASVVHINSWLHHRFIPKHLPCVTTFHSFIHDPALDRYKGPLKKLYHRFWVRAREARAIARSEVITAVSRYVAKAVADEFNCERPRLIYNWVSNDLFKPLATREHALPIKLLFVGKLGVLKGVDLLPRIMTNLGGDYLLYYTGTQEEMSKLAVPTANMIALGHIQDRNLLVQTYQSCHILLFPSRLEGFGLVALEAQSCGLPVIASDCSSLPEVVKNGETGLLCRPDDVSEFASAVRQLADRAVWHRMSAASVNHARSTFPEQMAVRRYMNVYLEALGGASR